jgi:hypothetical protein
MYIVHCLQSSSISVYTKQIIRLLLSYGVAQLLLSSSLLTFFVRSLKYFLVNLVRNQIEYALLYVWSIMECRVLH